METSAHSDDLRDELERFGLGLRLADRCAIEEGRAVEVLARVWRRARRDRLLLHAAIVHQVSLGAALLVGAQREALLYAGGAGLLAVAAIFVVSVLPWQVRALRRLDRLAFRHGLQQPPLWTEVAAYIALLLVLSLPATWMALD